MLRVSLCYYLIPTALILYVIRKYRESKWGKCTNNVDLSNKIIIVTGANSGIGYQTVKELARRNAQVILACRSIDKAKKTIASIEKEVHIKQSQLIPMVLDLASLMSVKTFAHNVLETFSRIDILINNAGVAYPKGKHYTTEDGLEIHFGVNHLGHFYLTTLLLDKLKQSSARVIIIASTLYEKGVVDLNDLNGLNAGRKANLYANSKLENVYFCHELAKRTQQSGLTTYAACPGWVYTSLFRHSIKWYHYIFVLPIAFFFMRSPRQGSQTTVYCATEPDLANESGLIYRDCQHYKSKMKFSDSISVSLWEKSEEIINGIVK